MGSHLLTTQDFINWKRLRIHCIQLLHIKSEEAVISLRSAKTVDLEHRSLGFQPKETLGLFLPLLESRQTCLPEGV